MGIMTFLRNRAGIIIVVVIGLAIVAFLVSDAVRLGQPFWAANQNVVGEVAGTPIDIVEFNQKVDQASANFKQQMGGNLNAQMTSYIQENTWNQEVSSILMDKEVARLGLTVSKNELNDMISGKNPDPQVVQNFGDPQTGQINRPQLNQFLGRVDAEPSESPLRQQWNGFLVGLKQNRLAQKYNNLVKNCVYVTSLEAREDYMERNKLANFNYIILPYSSIPDNKVTITDEDYKNYYEENKARFKNQEETRSFEYVVFDAAPSKSDSAEAKAAIAKVAADFRTSTNDSLFVSINADTKAPVSYVHKGQLDPALDSLVFNAANGSIVGPVFSNGSYKVAKVIDQRIGPDSVKASHILFNPATEGGLDKAKAKADSVANLIRKGASFAELAKKFGTDASKDKGGDLGTFGRGAMIPQFEEAVFNGSTGDLKVITTQYGVHVIHIDKQVGSSKVAKVAVVDKALNSSNKTQQEAYSKASAFLSSVEDSKNFDAAAKKSGSPKLTADNVTGSQSAIQGLDNSRKVIKWAFSAEEGDVSDEVFELDNKYAVAKLTDIRPKGTLPLDKVKKQIEPMVRNKVKARMLKEKFDTGLSGASSIQQVSQKVQAQVVPVQNIVFANPIIPGLAQENRVVGTVFGLQPNKLSKAIEGEQGVYVVSVNGFSNPAPLTNTIRQKEQISQSIAQRVQGEAFRVLRDKANIKDNRYKFF
jgi:peptidyl-prolyl cis-trans isomerase D